MQAPLIRIGSRALIANFPCLQIPKGETAKINIDVNGWKIPISLEFEDQGTVQTIDIKPEQDGVRLIFKNWSNSIGTALQLPAQLAVLVDGTKIEFLAASYRIGETNLLSVQLLHTGSAE